MRARVRDSARPAEGRAPGSAAIVQTMKNTLIFMLAGALLGIVIASFIIPPALVWYSEPGGLPGGASVQALVQIPDVIRYTTGKLLRWQLIGGVVGAVLGLILAILLMRKKVPTTVPVGVDGSPSPN